MSQSLHFIFLLWALIICRQIGYSQQNALYFPPKTGASWQTIAPETLGFCPDRIDSLYHFLEQQNTKSFVLLKDGRIALEQYFGSFTQDSFWYWASAGKSVTAFMIGQAQEEGLLKISDRSSQYLGTGWTVCPPDKEALITIRHQLTMTSGLNDNLAPTTSVPDPDNCEAPTCLQYLADAGTRWAYHNAPYTLLQTVIEAAGKTTINQFTKTRLFDRTGMKGLWLDNVLYGRARDMARFGLLIQAGGAWNGDSLLRDRQYFYNMTHRAQALNKSYGYLWWLNGQESFMLPSLQLVFGGPLIPNAPGDLIAALGKNDQKVHVVPSKGWVVVRQGNAALGPNGSQVPTVFDNALWHYLNALTCQSSGISGVAAPAFSISPNPATVETGWQIKTEGPLPEIVRLFSADGRMCWQGTDSGYIPAFGLEAGVYVLHLQWRARTAVVKAVLTQ